MTEQEDKFRVITKEHCYIGGDIIPHTIFIVQMLKKGFFFDRWIDIRYFRNNRKAKELLKLLEE